MGTWWFVVLLACGGEEPVELPGIEGEVVTAETSGLVQGSKAFGYVKGTQGAWYVTSTESATCEDVVSYLSSGPFDPVAVHAPGHCNLALTATVDGDSVVFDETENFLVGFWNLSCAMGEGEFAWEERDNGYADWFWSGYSWTGIAIEHETAVSPAESGGWSVEVFMDSYEGDYDGVGDVPGEGEVSGVVVAEPCPGLVGTALLPG
ncbi:MAG: hypothetical protein VX519_03185 [Myxococcota bacterium]|nr:hypothetical protein [Myxococcota bacterium]